MKWKRLTRRRTGGVDLEPGDTVLAFDVGFGHLAECMVRFTPETNPPFELLEWNLIDLDAKKTADAVAAFVALALGRRGYWPQVSHVVIEQQDKVNTKMVAMSHAIQATIAALGGPRAVFASSRAKFSVFATMVGLDAVHPYPTSASASQRKTIRKNNSIRICKEMLKDMDDTPIEFMEKLVRGVKKKDDLADAFVYASAFIFKHAPIDGQSSQPVPRFTFTPVTVATTADDTAQFIPKSLPFSSSSAKSSNSLSVLEFGLDDDEDDEDEDVDPVGPGP